MAPVVRDPVRWFGQMSTRNKYAAARLEFSPVALTWRPSPSPRDRAIWDAVEHTDRTYREIGRDHGISQERVRQIWANVCARDFFLAQVRDEATRPLLARRVEFLPLTARARNGLRNARNDANPIAPFIVTISDLLLWTPGDLLRVKNFGVLSLREIYAYLRAEHCPGFEP